ncbi:MAG: hypothetical protein Q7J69_06695 [Candidatus Omnitrophota bacterium]|nr:hypothetical protein [Candidatus Omnitrophota bacterium]
MATTILTTMKKKPGPKFRTLEPWQVLVLAEESGKNPKKLRKR